MSGIEGLVERVKAGESGAVDLLVERLTARLRLDEWRLDRDELRQEAAACGLESLARGELMGSRDPEALLVRRFRSRLRRRLYAHRRDARALTLEADGVDGLIPSAPLDLIAVPPRMWAAMRELTPSQRVAIWATYWEERRDADVAHEAGVSRQRVVGLRHRAVALLRAHLEG